MWKRRELRILLATAVAGLGAPLTASAWLSARGDALAAHLGVAGGVPARIGAIDADLTGTIRLCDVALGGLIAADAVEASVALDSLLEGALRADEIRVAGPRVAVNIARDGDSDLARVARRLLGQSGAPSDRPGPDRLRRIVISAGSLVARIAGVGELAADGVELVPDASGIRVITGAVRFDGRAGPLRVALGFARGAAELTLPHLRLGRVLAVSGVGSVAAQPAPGPPPGQGAIASAGSVAPPAAFQLREVSVGRLRGPRGEPLGSGSALELRASVDDGGIPRPLAIDLLPRDAAIAIRGDHLPLAALAPLAPAGVELAAAHATGSLALRGDAAHFELDVDGALDGVSIDHRVVAAGPVPLAATVHASLAISPDAIAVSRAAIELGAAHWTASGWLRRGTPASGQLEVALATAPCSELLAAIPGELRGPLDGMVLSGSFGGRLRATIDLAAPAGDGVELSAAISDACRSEAEPPTADVARLAMTTDQGFADGSRARIGRGEPGWAALHQLPGYVASAFVSAEDARFYDHAGFDLGEIAKSLEIDLREHRLARGGSTISQQLIKNAFLSQRRSFDRKLQEAILTWRLEARLSKAQILERYLNLIELGPRIHGLGAAASYWFDSSPRELSLRHAAFLAALTSEPTAMGRRVRRAAGLDAESAARVDLVLRAMWRDGAINAEQYDAARRTPLRFTPTALKQER
jgi:hypothetical protein